MFRVTARAFIYLDLSMVVLFALFSHKLLQLAFSAIKAPYSVGKRAVSTMAIVLLVASISIGLADVCDGRLVRTFSAHPLPDVKIYESLRGKEPGLLLEFPVLSPITDDTAKAYPYFYNRIEHGFPIANIWYPPPSNVEFREILDRLAKHLNTLSSQAILDLKHTGIRYLVVNKAEINHPQFRKSEHIRLISDGQNKSLFEIIPDEKFGQESFLEYFVYGEPTLVFRGFRQEERQRGIYWRWAGKSGEVTLKNNSKKGMVVRFGTGIFSPKGSIVSFSSEPFHDSIEMADDKAKYIKMINLKAGSSLKIKVASNANPHPGHPNLVFQLFNYTIDKIE